VVVDATSGQLVAGATVEVFDANGQVVATLITDGRDPGVIPLPRGSYTLRATAHCGGSSGDQTAAVPLRNSSSIGKLVRTSGCGTQLLPHREHQAGVGRAVDLVARSDGMLYILWVGAYSERAKFRRRIVCRLLAGPTATALMEVWCQNRQMTRPCWISSAA
jgi:hypothetical protein